VLIVVAVRAMAPINAVHIRQFNLVLSKFSRNWIMRACHWNSLHAYWHSR
jgi:hypothetical protein